MSEKKTWRVTGTVVGGTYIGEYEAETGEAALDKAVDDADVSFCHQCSGGCEDPRVLLMVAEHDRPDGEIDVVERDMGYETDWESKASAAGWRPPAKPRKARGGR